MSERGAGRFGVGRRAIVVLSNRSFLRWLDALAVVAILIAASLAFVEVDRYVQGFASVEASGSVQVSSYLDGIVETVLAVPGERVKEGQPIARLYRAAEHEEVSRLDREIELELITLLQNPADAKSRSRIITLRAARVAAETRFRERLVRAPQAGTVTSLWVKAGQRVAGGDRVASVTPATGVSYTLLAVLPGSSLSQVRVGQTMRFNPDGLQRSYQEHRVIWIATEAVGPAQVARFFGPERGDAFPLSGVQALVRASVESSHFELDGQRYPYREGLTGRVWLRVRRERLLTCLFPVINSFQRLGLHIGL